MDREQQSEAKSNKVTPITRAWRIGGPMTADQRKEAKSLFIESLKIDPNISLACDNAFIARKTAYEWREKDSKFADEWEAALERTRDVARSSIYRRGILGWEEKVASQGQVVMEYEPVVDEEGNQRFDEKGRPLMRGGKPLLIRKYSDTLAVAYAKANLPEYKEKQQVDLYQHVAEMAEQDKQSLLANLDVAIANDKKKSSQEKEL